MRGEEERKTEKERKTRGESKREIGGKREGERMEEEALRENK